MPLCRSICGNVSSLLSDDYKNNIRILHNRWFGLCLRLPQTGLRWSSIAATAIIRKGSSEARNHTARTGDAGIANQWEEGRLCDGFWRQQPCSTWLTTAANVCHLDRL